MTKSKNLERRPVEVSDDYPSDDDSFGFKRSLNARLDQVKTPGSFAAAGQCPNVPVPGLSVEGSGLIGLPLTETAAKSIINVCHQAPFGQGIMQLSDHIHVIS